LITKTGEQIVAREVFARFTSYGDFDSDVKMPELLENATSGGRASEAHNPKVVSSNPTPATI
jgi:hypothetical protein